MQSFLWDCLPESYWLEDWEGVHEVAKSNYEDGRWMEQAQDFYSSLKLGIIMLQLWWILVFVYTRDIHRSWEIVKTICISRLCFVLPSHKGIYVMVVQMKAIHGSAECGLDDNVKVQRCCVSSSSPGSSLGGTDHCLLGSNATLFGRMDRLTEYWR
jgi:hypothetical protein